MGVNTDGEVYVALARGVLRFRPTTPGGLGETPPGRGVAAALGFANVMPALKPVPCGLKDCPLIGNVSICVESENTSHVGIPRLDLRPSVGLYITYAPSLRWLDRVMVYPALKPEGSISRPEYNNVNLNWAWPQPCRDFMTAEFRHAADPERIDASTGPTYGLANYTAGWLRIWRPDGQWHDGLHELRLGTAIAGLCQNAAGHASPREFRISRWLRVALARWRRFGIVGLALALAAVLFTRSQPRLSWGLIALSALALLSGVAYPALPATLSTDPDVQIAALMTKAEVRPPTNPPTPSPELVKLGEALFWDPELSGNRDIACATCHHPLKATGDNLSVSLGTQAIGLGENRVRLEERRDLIPRNAPPVFNLGYTEWTVLFWDGRVSGDKATGFDSPASDRLPKVLDNLLAAQALFPVTSRDEMRGLRGDKDIFGNTNELANLRNQS